MRHSWLICTGLGTAARRLSFRLGVFAVGLLPAVQGSAQPSDTDTLAVYGNMTTVELAPVLVAIARGLYPGSVTINHGGIPNLYGVEIASERYEAGIAPIVTHAETQALRFSTANPDLRIIFTVAEGLYRIVAKRSSGVESLADLRGKRIATIPNTSANYFLHRMLETAGLGIDDVFVGAVPALSDYATALTTGGFDAVSAWEPGAEYAAESIGDDAIEFHDPRAYRELFNLNTRVEHLENVETRARIVDFVRALIRASAVVNSQPEVAWPLVAEASGLDVSLIARVWRHQAYPGTLVDDLLDVLVAEDVWVARETDRAPRTRSELAKLIDTTVLAEALVGLTP